MEETSDMTPQQTLEKIIEKAVKGRWKHWGPVHPKLVFERERHGALKCITPLEVMIFDHSFAKAFWSNSNKFPDDAWRNHLSHLALTPPEERLSYLEKYL